MVKPALADQLTDPVEDKLARIRERYSVPAAYTIDDLAKVPPCPLCGARARIEGGRLTMVCDLKKHYPTLDPPAPKPAEPVQRSFGDDAKEPWWNR